VNRARPASHHRRHGQYHQARQGRDAKGKHSCSRGQRGISGQSNWSTVCFALSYTLRKLVLPVFAVDWYVHPIRGTKLIHLSSIKLTTAAPQSQTFEGTLFTACPILNVVAINTRPAATGDSGDYHIIPISRIQNFQITSLASSQQQSSVLPPVDTKRLKEREKARIAQLKEQAADRGKGVSKEAQAIYDSLKRV
jgi:hypothetical protein